MGRDTHTPTQPLSSGGGGRWLGRQPSEKSRIWLQFLQSALSLRGFASMDSTTCESCGKYMVKKSACYWIRSQLKPLLFKRQLCVCVYIYINVICSLFIKQNTHFSQIFPLRVRAWEQQHPGSIENICYTHVSVRARQFPKREGWVFSTRKDADRQT